MSLRITITLMLALSLASVNAQLTDSLRVLLDQSPRVAVKLDGRGAFVSNRPVRMLGFKVGLEHGRRLQYGLGYSFLRTPVSRLDKVTVNGAELEVDTELRMGLFTPYIEYAFYQDGPWQVSIPVQFGLGTGYREFELNGEKQKTDRTFLFIYEPAMSVQYRFFRYFALSGGLGYRLVFKDNDVLTDRLTAPIYLLGFRIFFDDLLRDSRRAGDTGSD